MTVKQEKKRRDLKIIFNCSYCNWTLAISSVDCSLAICPNCGNQISISTESTPILNKEEGSAQELSTFSLSYVALLDDARFTTFEQRCQILIKIETEFRRIFPYTLNKKASAIVDKYSNHVTLIIETIHISPGLFDQMKTFLRDAFRPYESDKSGSYREIKVRNSLHNNNPVYPEWSKLKNNLDLLHPLMLQQLRSTMCFIVIDQGKQHAATIVRIPSSEFPNTIEKNQMRLHIGLCRTKYADVFFFYPVVADSKRLWWTETWIYPYDDELIGPSPVDPLAKDARKRLNLLLNQEYSYTLIVDENNNLRCARKIFFTKSQREGFPKLTDLLIEYEGKVISLIQAKNAMDDYLVKISKSQLQQQFELLLREE